MSDWKIPQKPECDGVTDVTAKKGDGWKVLADLEAFLKRFVSYPGSDEPVAHVLWIAHCWFMDAWESTPRLAFLSPEPGSGKSRALEVTEPFVPRPVHAVNATPAYLFRKVSDPDGRPTILFDEIDTVFGPKAKDNEDLRGLLNAGHRKGAMAGRCVIRGKEVLTEELPAYAAVALAGLDDLPDTIMTRSVVIRMRRRKPGERIEPWRLRTCGPEAERLADRLRKWTQSVSGLAGMSWPEMPEGVEDRDADVWEALLAVADLAGGVWPERARQAAVNLVAKSKEKAPTIGVMLLRDIRTVFDAEGSEQLASESLVDRLVELEESPWGDIRGKSIDARGLARRLAKYMIRPHTVRDGMTTFKGYRRDDFADAWQRYLPSRPLPDLSVTTVTPSQIESECDRVTDVTVKNGNESEEIKPVDGLTVTNKETVQTVLSAQTVQHPTPKKSLPACSICGEPMKPIAGLDIDHHPTCGEW